LHGVRRHAILLGAILVVVGALYARVSAAGYCGYDDFNEAYRAAFFDGKMPSRILTAVHFERFMYRPVTSALQLGTWQLFGHAAAAFRLRNLGMHLVAIAAVYGIAFLLGRSRSAATAAAALFGFNPYANEAVVVAIWTNTTAYAIALGAVLSFVIAVRAAGDGRPWGLPLGTSLTLVAIALFTYEPTIVAFAIMVAYLVLRSPRRQKAFGRFEIAFAAGCAGCGALFFGVRHVVGVASAGLLPAGEIVRDTAAYLVALELPIDPVLANALFGTPLPLAGSAPSLALLVAPAVYGAFLVGALAWGIARPLGDRIASIDWRTIGFALAAIPLSLGPILLYKPHLSEFNLYLPAAFYAIALALLLRHFCRDRTAFAILAGLLLISYAAGTWVRNDRVIACANVVSRIERGLPIADWQSGSRHVLLATPPGERLTPRYGIYDYAGIETLEVAATPIRGAQEALRLWTGNERLDADVVPPAAFAQDCRSPDTCYYVFANGDVRDVRRGP